MFRRGDPPPSPHCSNEAVARGYNAALAESSAANAASTPDSDDFEIDLDAEIEIEAVVMGEQAAAAGQPLQQQLAPPALALPAAPFAFLQPATAGSWRHVVVPNAPFMPPFRGTKVPYTPPGATDAIEIDIEPKPSTEHTYGNIVLARLWMGGGKTTAKKEYQKVLIRENPQMRVLDLV